jgi:diaminopimelate epimerase
MQYWNADGSPAEMCGNGLRCVARYALDRGLVSGSAFSVLTAIGERAVEVLEGGDVRACLGPVSGPVASPLEVAGYRLESVSVGNPHAVAIVPDCYSVPVEAVGPIVEGDPHFPERTNVEFVTVTGRDRIDVRVWERGVGETLACGTGAVAAAWAARSGGLTGERVTVVLPGGELRVELAGGEAWIQGPATTVFSGTLAVG